MKAAGIVDAVGPKAKAQVTQRSPQRQFGRGGCGIHCGISTHGIRDGRHQICGDFGEGWFDQLHHYGKGVSHGHEFAAHVCSVPTKEFPTW